MLNNLFKRTALQQSFAGNMMAVLGGGRMPEQLTLRRALLEFIEFRVECVQRRTAFELKKAETRKAKLKAGVRGAGSTLVRKMTGGVVGGPKSKPGAPGSAFGGSAESFTLRPDGRFPLHCPWLCMVATGS